MLISQSVHICFKDSSTGATRTQTCDYILQHDLRMIPEQIWPLEKKIVHMISIPNLLTIWLEQNLSYLRHVSWSSYLYHAFLFNNFSLFPGLNEILKPQIFNVIFWAALSENNHFKIHWHMYFSIIRKQMLHQKCDVAPKKANVFTDDSSFDQSSSNPLIQQTNVVTSTSTGVRLEFILNLYLYFIITYNKCQTVYYCKQFYTYTFF